MAEQHLDLEALDGRIQAALVGRTLVLELEMAVSCEVAHPTMAIACVQPHYKKSLIQARIADIKR